MTIEDDRGHSGLSLLRNRLSEETSPYLLQHADNPVHWQPWDDRAFQAARETDRPIFLSIGYSTCHWCHVMEKESFENGAVAALMNDAFVCVKVDREERPDIDGVYMRYAAAMIGSGGWPLNMVMTPDGKPFFAATYIPAGSSFGRVGMLELVPLIDNAWRNRREEVVSAAGSLAGSLFGEVQVPPRADAPEDPAGSVFRRLRSSYDSRWGGFGEAPKFPAAHNMLFLLRYFRYRGDTEAMEMACRTLAAIRYGGIWDQLGGGLHRYSTDREWHVPHFEKMLYDQSVTALAALEAFQATGGGLYREMAAGLLDFVMDRMRSPDGGFFSALDADSPDGEGAYYAWRMDELAALLGPGRASGIAELWGIDREGDLDGIPGGNIPRLRFPPPGQLPPSPPPAPDPEVRRILLEHRGRRPAPMMDRKVQADWNGMTAAALARGSRVLSRPDFLEAARECIGFMTRSMVTDDGKLMHSWTSGSPGCYGYLDDYAYVIWACIELHNATLEDGFANMALSLQAVQDSMFRDPSAGWYRFSGGEGEGIPIPGTVETHDGAVPSGSSVTLMNLYRLRGMTGEDLFEERAEALAESLSGALRSAPSSHTMLAAAMLSGPAHADITLAGRPGDAALHSMLEAAWSVFLPDMTVSLDGSDGPASARVCFRGTCLPSAGSSNELARLLDGLR
ncbi:MAG: hypothetical protein AVO35_06905 [Candidatus Aegiribacteria sp. MLS_C]|nr:MAG: hypothetical protein AVO35_06905 [Candidatus Aegiribacteria sp. MLS_C]